MYRMKTFHIPSRNCLNNIFVGHVKSSNGDNFCLRLKKAEGCHHRSRTTCHACCTTRPCMSPVYSFPAQNSGPSGICLTSLIGNSGSITRFARRIHPATFGELTGKCNGDLALNLCCVLDVSKRDFSSVSTKLSQEEQSQRKNKVPLNQDQSSSSDRHDSVIQGFRKLENHLRFRGYSTVRIAVAMCTVIGLGLYLLRDPIRENVVVEVSQVASRSLEHEEVVGKAEEFAKSLLHTLLHDERMHQLASQFIKQVLNSPETRKAGIEYISSILVDPDTRQLLALTIRQVLLLAIHDPETTAALKAVVVVILSDPDSQHAARRLMKAVFTHEELREVAAVFFADVIKSQQVLNQATQLGKSVTYNVITDPNLKEATGQSLWQAFKYSVTPGWFAGSSPKPPAPPSTQGMVGTASSSSSSSSPGPSSISPETGEPESTSSLQSPTPALSHPSPPSATSSPSPPSSPSSPSSQSSPPSPPSPPSPSPPSSLSPPPSPPSSLSPPSSSSSPPPPSPSSSSPPPPSLSPSSSPLQPSPSSSPPPPLSPSPSISSPSPSPMPSPLPPANTPSSSTLHKEAELSLEVESADPDSDPGSSEMETWDEDQLIDEDSNILT